MREKCPKQPCSFLPQVKSRQNIYEKVSYTNALNIRSIREVQEDLYECRRAQSLHYPDIYCTLERKGATLLKNFLFLFFNCVRFSIGERALYILPTSMVVSLGFFRRPPSLPPFLCLFRSRLVSPLKPAPSTLSPFSPPAIFFAAVVVIRTSLRKTAPASNMRAHRGANCDLAFMAGIFETDRIFYLSTKDDNKKKDC